MASAEQPRSSVPPPPSLVRLNSHSHSHSHSNPNSHPNSNTPLSHSSLPPLLPSPVSGYASLADGIKNSPRRMNTDTALPLVGSSSSSIGSGAGDDREVNGGQQRRTGASATPGPAADHGAADANANGSGSGSGDAAGAKPKKKKKKGWKGWALVLEDEEGNVIEVRDRGESPETEKRRIEEDAEKERATRAAASREGSTAMRDGTPGMTSNANVASGSRTRPRTSASPFVGGRKSSPAVATPATAVSTAPRSRKRTTPPRRDTSVPATASAAAGPATAPSSARSIPDRASSDLTDEDDTEDTSYTNIILPPAKKKRTVAPGRAASTHADSAPPSSDPATATPSAPPPSTKATPAATNAPASKPKLINTRPSRATPNLPETRAGTSASRTATPGPPPTAVVVMDDQPLPKVPRVGMGEVYPQPAESDIRAEANFIINAAKRKREEDRVSHLREESPSGGDRPSPQGVADLTPPPSRGGPSAADDKAGLSAAASGSRQSMGAAGARNGGEILTPQTAPARRQSQGGSASQAAYAQPSSAVASSSRIPPQSMAPPARSFQNGSSSNGNSHDHGRHPHHPPSNSQSTLPSRLGDNGDNADVFEDEFDAIEQGYLTGKHATAHSQATAARVLSEHIIAPQEVALGRGPNDPVPPRFHPGQKPTVVLAPEGSRIRPRDRFDKEHADGFDGLPPQVQTDCEGFVENVRENLRNIIMYFFPQPSVRRDAFLERVGRGLTDLGWNLVDNGDLALIRRQGDGLFMPPGPPGQAPGHLGQPGHAGQAGQVGQQGYAGPPPRQDRR